MQIFLIAGLIFSWYVKDFDVKAELSRKNIINVSEFITVDFGNERRHGIFRFIPSVYRGHPVSLKVQRVYNATNGSDKHKISRKMKNVLIKIGDPNVIVSGINNYMIDYTMKYVVFDTTNHDRLVWNATGNFWSTTIKHASFRLKLPDGLKANNVECFTGSTGSKGTNCECHFEGEDIICETTKGLGPYSGMTVIADFPPNSFKQPGFLTKFWWKFGTFWPLLIPVIVFIVMYRKWLKYGRDPRMGAIATAYEPPKDLSPIEAGTLIDEIVNARDLTAEILNLAIKGYLKIEETPDKKDYIIAKLKECDDSLEDYQCEILDSLFMGAGEYVDIEIKGDDAKTKKIKEYLKKLYADEEPSGTKDLKEKLRKKADKKLEYADFLQKLEELEEKYKVVALSSLKNVYYIMFDNIKKVIYDRLTERGFFADNPEKIRNNYSIYGILLIIFSFIFVPISMSNPVRLVLGIVSMNIADMIVIIFGKYLPRKTEKGVEALRKLKGLREFIHRVEKERLKKFALDNPEMFKNLLPYAVAFGDERKWAEVFAEIYEVLRERTGLTTVYVTGSAGFTSMVTSMQSSLTTSPSSGGGGSGGSFSGGGAGGGGGGAW